MMQKVTFDDRHEAALFMMQRFGALAAFQAQICVRALCAAGKRAEAAQWRRIHETLRRPAR